MTVTQAHSSADQPNAWHSQYIQYRSASARNGITWRVGELPASMRA